MRLDERGVDKISGISESARAEQGLAEDKCGAPGDAAARTSWWAHRHPFTGVIPAHAGIQCSGGSETRACPIHP